MQPSKLPLTTAYLPSSTTSSSHRQQGGANGSGAGTRSGGAARERERFTRIENTTGSPGRSAHNDDSWIEVSSQPSDESYTSSSSSSEIILEGLVVQNTNLQQRQRKKRKSSSRGLDGFSSLQIGKGKVYDKDADDLSEIEVIDPGSSGPGSSIGELPLQEDLESSSSAAGEEDDSSSDDAHEDSDDGEDTGTMLGVGCNNTAATNSASATRASSYASISSQQYLHPHHRHSSTHNLHHHQQRPTPQSQNYYPHPRATDGRHTGYRHSSYSRPPPTKADHDEALMASLSTLLSCAAAARALPKVAMAAQQASSSGRQSYAATMASSRVQLDTLQLVPDHLMGGEKPSNSEKKIDEPVAGAGAPSQSRRGSITMIKTGTNTPSGDGAPSIKRRNSASASSDAEGGRTRKKASSPRSKSRGSRKALSLLDSNNNTISVLDTNVSYLTLAFSAGAVIILSAITFSAGYALGKEVGRSEAEAMGDVVGRAAKGSVGLVKETARGGGRGLVGGVGRRVVSVSA